MTTDAIGWISAAVLLITLGRQVYTEWRSNTIAGLSRWLFLGQIAASIGFVVYSVLVQNWVFVVTNFLIGITAVVGQTLYWMRTRRDAQRSASAGAGKPRVRGTAPLKSAPRRAAKPRPPKGPRRKPA